MRENPYDPPSSKATSLPEEASTQETSAASLRLLCIYRWARNAAVVGAGVGLIVAVLFLPP